MVLRLRRFESNILDAGFLLTQSFALFYGHLAQLNCLGSFGRRKISEPNRTLIVQMKQAFYIKKIEYCTG